jgi:hypothetical protein
MYHAGNISGRPPVCLFCSPDPNYLAATVLSVFKRLMFCCVATVAKILHGIVQNCVTSAVVSGSPRIRRYTAKLGAYYICSRLVMCGTLRLFLQPKTERVVLWVLGLGYATGVYPCVQSYSGRPS